jgi:hypothetical protein
MTASLSEEHLGAEESTTVPPPTPIRQIQEVGQDLEIPADQLTVEKLMVNPKDDKLAVGDD